MNTTAIIVLLVLGLALSLALSGFQFNRHRRQKQQIKNLYEDIHRFLTEGTYNFMGSLEDYREGDFAILQNETGKLIHALRSQADTLKADKILLKDSMEDISHQIRTPLTSVRLIASMLAEPDLSHEEQFSCVEQLNRQLDKTDGLIASLLKLAQLDAGALPFKREPVPFGELACRMEEQLGVLLDIRDQSLVPDIQPESCFLGDLNWTAEAVANIIKNCAEHMPTGRRIFLTATENALYAQLLIEDEGPGIPTEDLPHIFERFYRGKNASVTGTGIGLCLSRKLITAQDGTIKAENRKEGGCRFTILLPLPY